MGIEFGLYYSHALKNFFSEAKGFTVPFFMKEGVDGAARRGNCARRCSDKRNRHKKV